jgi:hypothetical protein
MSDGLDRRHTARRRTIEEHGIVQARVRPGRDVVVIDISAEGVLIESAHQLRPGSSVDLQLATREHHVAVRGRVLRCSIARLLASNVWYRGAIGFDRHLPWLLDEREAGYSLPNAEMRRHSSERGDSSRPVL